MNVRKFTPCVLAETSEDNPVPNTNRNRNGWIKEVKMRRRSREKRISSRRQTALIARNSERTLRAGTCGRASTGSEDRCAGDVVRVRVATQHAPRRQGSASAQVAGQRASIDGTPSRPCE